MKSCWKSGCSSFPLNAWSHTCESFKESSNDRTITESYFKQSFPCSQDLRQLVLHRLHKPVLTVSRQIYCKQHWVQSQSCRNSSRNGVCPCFRRSDQYSGIFVERVDAVSIILAAPMRTHLVTECVNQIQPRDYYFVFVMTNVLNYFL